MGTKSRLVLAAVGVAFAAATASGCGGVSTKQKQAKAEAAQHAARLAAYRSCRAQTSRFLTALQDLDSRLDVGLSLDAYVNRLGDVKVAHDVVPARQLRYSCRKKVGGPAEAALSSYLDGYKMWNDCVTKFAPSCTLDDPVTKSLLQTFWSIAHKDIRKANAGLDQLRAG